MDEATIEITNLVHVEWHWRVSIDFPNGEGSRFMVGRAASKQECHEESRKAVQEIKHSIAERYGEGD